MHGQFRRGLAQDPFEAVFLTGSCPGPLRGSFFDGVMPGTPREQFFDNGVVFRTPNPLKIKISLVEA